MNEKTDSGATPTILVVDDEPLILKNIELLLKAKGNRVLTAADGRHGLELALKERPDVVLLDVMLPDVEGYEICRKIKNDPLTRHIPVLMLTALNDVFSKVKGLDAGADDFISKPFNEGELHARVRAFLRTKRLHDELDESYRRLKELEEMRDSLTHMIMHDLVAPLTAIQIGVESVMDRAATNEPLGPAHERMLKAAHEGCKRLMDMLRDVLTVSRLEEKKLPLSVHPTDLKNLILSSVAGLEPTRAIAEVKIVTETDAAPAARCDPALITRVVTNLVSNSIKFTPAGGTITIGAAAAPDGVEVYVKDTGLGIPKENQERIFDKFFQAGDAQTARKGQGLGLAFCRLAVEAHGGRIWVESEPGKGSRFAFRLPNEIRPG